MPCFLFNNFSPFFVSFHATFKLTGRNILGYDSEGPLPFHRMPNSGIGKADLLGNIKPNRYPSNVLASHRPPFQLSPNSTRRIN
jgi:hypothetical protein